MAVMGKTELCFPLAHGYLGDNNRTVQDASGYKKAHENLIDRLYNLTIQEPLG